MGDSRLRFDQIGYWSQIKLDIVRDYAQAYSTILAKQPRLAHVYVDAFAGAGVHQLKATGELVPGSPLNALAVEESPASVMSPNRFRCAIPETQPCTTCSSHHRMKQAQGLPDTF